MAQSQDSKSLLDISGLDNLTDTKVGIAYTEWNEKIVTEQIAGAKRILSQSEVTTDLYAVPGSFELPFASKQLATNGKYNAIIAFGAVIRGGTPHFDYVCKAVTEGITMLNTSLSIPIIFGVLTLDNEDQAWERLGGAYGHKGEEAAITALKMIQFSRNLSK